MLEDMKLDLPRYTERFGATSLHGVQRVYELDSGFDDGSTVSESIVNIGNNQIVDIERRMAIVIPTKGERLRLLEGGPERHTPRLSNNHCIKQRKATGR